MCLDSRLSRQTFLSNSFRFYYSQNSVAFLRSHDLIERTSRGSSMPASNAPPRNLTFFELKNGSFVAENLSCLCAVAWSASTFSTFHSKPVHDISSCWYRWDCSAAGQLLQVNKSCTSVVASNLFILHSFSFRSCSP